MMKIIIIMSFVLMCFISFSQESNCIKKESVYNDLKEKRHSDSLWKTEKLTELKESYVKDTNNESLIFSIAKIYYYDFLTPHQEKRRSRARYLYQPQKNIYDSIAFDIKEEYFKKSIFKNSADSALSYLKKIKNKDSNNWKISFFAIKQLECYVYSDSSFVDLSIYSSPSNYIPYWHLAKLGENWRCDFSRNYIAAIGISLIYLPSIESSMINFDEKPLFLKDRPSNTVIFRMIFRPSFSDDICIRVESKNESVSLYWKIRKKIRGNTTGIIKEGVKELTRERWNYILQLIRKMNFFYSKDNMDILSTDGASWFIEYKTNDLYNAFYQKLLTRNTEELCLYLLELSEVDYKTMKWNTNRSGIFTYDLILTEGLKYVIAEDVEDTLIACINQFAHKAIAEKKCCCYFDSFIKFSKKGKIKKVKYPRNVNWGFDLWNGLQGRKCRKVIKQALKNIDLSYLNLSKPLYYYLEMDYVKEINLFLKK